VARVACWCERLGSRGMRFAYEVTRGDERLVTGTTDHVWIDKAKGRPCRTPETLLEPFERLAGMPQELDSIQAV
ncbi:MAG: acyl-CoA thioesterase, partial [bacterium]